MENKKNKGGRPRKEPTYIFSIRVSKPMKEFLSKPDNKGKINKFIKELVEESDLYQHFLRDEYLKSNERALFEA